jgi:MFS family permease
LPQLNTYLTLLRENTNYRYLWLGSVISQFGDWFNLIASASLIANLTGSGTAVSYLFLARFLPLFIFSPFAGVLADRYDRRKIMIASDLLRGVTVLGFLLVREPHHVWFFYTLTVCQFTLSTLFVPARTAVLAALVKPEKLLAANVLDSFTWSTMLALGALLGGLTAAAFGLATAFVLDALTFVLSAWVISRIAPAATARPVLVTTSGGWFDFVEGLRYLKAAPFILAISLVKGLGSLAWGAVNVLEVTFAEEVFRIGPDGTAALGIIYAVSGVGTGFGPLLLRQLFGDTPVRLRWGIATGFVLMATGIFWLSLSQTLPTFAVGTLIRTVGSGTVWVFSAALLQMSVPNHVRGRVFAFEFAFLTLTQSLSIFWAGFALDYLHFDLWSVTATMGLVGIVVTGLWFLFHFWHLAAARPEQPAPDVAD